MEVSEEKLEELFKIYHSLCVKETIEHQRAVEAGADMSLRKLSPRDKWLKAKYQRMVIEEMTSQLGLFGDYARWLRNLGE